MKSYHITWDTKDLQTWDFDDTDQVAKTGLVAQAHPYLFVKEIGVTGKLHYHGYFHSTFSKNTIKNKLQELLETPVYFSNPDNPKYLKYSQDGVLGVEIYLIKGVKNHMRGTDDLKMTPFIKWHNIEYYGPSINEGRLQHIRNKYEKVVTSMKNYKSEVSKISKENKLSEWQLVLKDLTDLAIDTEHQIKDYLAYTHYTREKYNYSENGFKNLYRKIMKHKNINKYKNYIRQLMDVQTQ